MDKIYVANKGYHDYSYAEKHFGKLVFLSDRNINPIDVSQMLRLIDRYLNGSNANDKILITGLTIFNSLLCSFFTHKHGRLNLLIFKRNSKKAGQAEYILRETVFEEKQNGNGNDR